MRISRFCVAEVAKTFGRLCGVAESLGDFRYKIIYDAGCVREEGFKRSLANPVPYILPDLAASLRRWLKCALVCDLPRNRV